MAVGFNLKEGGTMEGNVDNQTLNRLKGKITSIPLVDETLSKNGYAADAKATGDGLAERVRKVDVVDNLNSTDSGKPLSANQGRELKKLIDNNSLPQNILTKDDFTVEGETLILNWL